MRGPESEFQSAVIEAAHWHGWIVHHTRAVQLRPGVWATPLQGDSGFPDLVLAHPDRGVIFAELKSARGRLSSEQDRWIRTLVACGAEAYVWRPTDMVTILNRLSRSKQ
jgi:hypothetical protein